MSFRITTTESSKPAEKTLAHKYFEEEEKEKITKKSFSSSNKTTTTTSKTLIKKNEKESDNITFAEQNNLRNLQHIQHRQRVALMNRQNKKNKNIQDWVSNLLFNFGHPHCKNCPNRKADRVCINKTCGIDKYMQIICGECHLNDHSSSITKSEINFEQFFTQLANFLYQSKNSDDMNEHQPRIDLDRLETIFNDLDLLREKLAFLKSQIENEIESYKSPMEMQNLLQNSITKALSLCEYDNIQEQLLNVKKIVLFDQNKFFWNDAGKKHKTYQQIFKNLDEAANQTQSKISKSFIGNTEINLDELSFKLTKKSPESLKNIEFKGKDSKIQVDSPRNSLTQFCLNYDLKSDKKYKFRFRFTSNPVSYIMIGVMEKRLCSDQWLSSVTDQYFYKRFQLDAYKNECSRNLKGGDLNKICVKEDQIEMRVDFENDYADFYDYPEMKSVNASHDNSKFVKGEDQVFTILFSTPQSVTLEYFGEILSIEDII